MRDVLEVCVPRTHGFLGVEAANLASRRSTKRTRCGWIDSRWSAARDRRQSIRPPRRPRRVPRPTMGRRVGVRRVGAVRLCDVLFEFAPKATHDRLELLGDGHAAVTPREYRIALIRTSGSTSPCPHVRQKIVLSTSALLRSKVSVEYIFVLHSPSEITLPPANSLTCDSLRDLRETREPFAIRSGLLHRCLMFLLLLKRSVLFVRLCTLTHILMTAT